MISGWQLTKTIFTTNPFKAKATRIEHIAKEIQKMLISLIFLLAAVGFGAYCLNAYGNVMSDPWKVFTIAEITCSSIVAILYLDLLRTWIKGAKRVNIFHDPITKRNEVRTMHNAL